LKKLSVKCETTVSLIVTEERILGESAVIFTGIGHVGLHIMNDEKQAQIN
jgi:hypothetical protein